MPRSRSNGTPTQVIGKQIGRQASTYRNLLAGGPISEMEPNILVKIALMIAIENDLMALPFP